ncbi:MAG TPA: hypothetical protein VGO21_00355 [Candidatus Paceibacterota bacterium]|jgi:hypothetical protein|nr:hypothetical protein [Candidatus Paceibacterota bacterium]
MDPYVKYTLKYIILAIIAVPVSFIVGGSIPSLFNEKISTLSFFLSYAIPLALITLRIFFFDKVDWSSKLFVFLTTFLIASIVFAWYGMTHLFS